MRQKKAAISDRLKVQHKETRREIERRIAEQNPEMSDDDVHEYAATILESGLFTIEKHSC